MGGRVCQYVDFTASPVDQSQCSTYVANGFPEITYSTANSACYFRYNCCGAGSTTPAATTTAAMTTTSYTTDTPMITTTPSTTATTTVPYRITTNNLSKTCAGDRVCGYVDYTVGPVDDNNCSNYFARGFPSITYTTSTCYFRFNCCGTATTTAAEPVST